MPGAAVSGAAARPSGRVAPTAGATGIGDGAVRRDERVEPRVTPEIGTSVNVVARGLMAAGMGIYAAMHVTQAANPPAGAPGWLAAAFALTALVAVAIAVMLVLTSTRHEVRWETAAALLAGASALALVASYTTGFLGVVESDLRAETVLVGVAHLVTLLAYTISRVVPSAGDELTGDPVVDTPLERSGS